MGWAGTFAFVTKEKFYRLLNKFFPANGRREYTLYSRFLSKPLLARACSSDREVFRQVLIDHLYDGLSTPIDASLIVDCGANVGYSTLFFAAKYPSAQILAVEPDPDNFKLLYRNTLHLGSRVQLFEAGLWPEVVGLSVRKGGFGDGLDWATQVEPTPLGETPDVDGINIEWILERSKADAIDLLKIDIECAEREVFRGNVDRWLPYVKTLVIEIHTPECREAILNALASYRYNLSERGDLTIFDSLSKRT
jgi:FkbM family methyltransferase